MRTGDLNQGGRSAFYCWLRRNASEVAASVAVLRLRRLQSRSSELRRVARAWRPVWCFIIGRCRHTKHDMAPPISLPRALTKNVSLPNLMLLHCTDGTSFDYLRSHYSPRPSRPIGITCGRNRNSMGIRDDTDLSRYISFLTTNRAAAADVLRTSSGRPLHHSIRQPPEKRENRQGYQHRYHDISSSRRLRFFVRRSR